jgi:hypothetical protein
VAERKPPEVHCDLTPSGNRTVKNYIFPLIQLRRSGEDSKKCKQKTIYRTILKFSHAYAWLHQIEITLNFPECPLEREI